MSLSSLTLQDEFCLVK